MNGRNIFSKGFITKIYASCEARCMFSTPLFFPLQRTSRYTYLYKVAKSVSLANSKKVAHQVLCRITVESTT